MKVTDNMVDAAFSYLDQAGIHLPITTPNMVISMMLEREAWNNIKQAIEAALAVAPSGLEPERPKDPAF